jgi:radical SAM protein with 4Fe4S-binding SPASM domain
MKLELYKKIIDQITWKPSIKLCQRGEPLVSPILEDAIEYATEKGLRTVINTNGIMLDKFKSKMLIQSGLKSLYLSDYGLDKQYMNGCIFAGMNQVYKHPVKFIVKTDNPEKWEGIADKIIPHVYFDYKNKEEDNTPHKNWACNQLFEKMVIDPDGKIRCCCGNVHPGKYIGHVSTGLSYVWVSSIVVHYRNLHSHGNSHHLEMCRQCAYRKSFIEKLKTLATKRLGL